MNKSKLIASEIKIETDKVFNDFNSHLNIEGNNKIIFSGKYGTGKSYFLNEFFTHTDISKKYNVITLSPIHYVVSQNEDVFELIKVDIIKNLFINNHLNLIEGDISLSKPTVIKEYIKNHPVHLTSLLIQSLSKIGIATQSIGETTAKISELIQHFSEFEKKLNTENTPNEKILENYGDEMLYKKGTYLEFNFISEIIKESLIKIKTLENENKENVLIIEDFDRLDPAHIFRILNIFSAHHDGDVGNKFGFDKVIIVCDLVNIKSLYEHMYGAEIDFNGYIDKFYSLTPYYFDNKKAIYFFLKNTLKLQIPDYALNSLTILLELLIEFDRITLRKIIKTSFIELKENKVLKEYSFKEMNVDRFIKFPPHIDHKVTSLRLYYYDVPLLIIIDYLLVLLGGNKELDQAIKFMQNYEALYARNKESSIDFAMLLAIPNKLIIKNNIDEHSKIFFKDLTSFHYPELSVDDFILTYSLKWIAGNKYQDTKTSYFEECSINKTSGNNNNMRFESALNKIKLFIDTAREEEWLN